MEESLAGEINHPSSDGIVFGAGSCRERLAELLGRSGIHRAFLVSTPSLSRSPLLNTVRESGIAEKLARAHARLTRDETSRAPDQDARKFVHAIEDLVRNLELPTRLREVNISQDDLPAIAEHAAHSFAIATNPRPVKDASELVELLERAW